MGCSVYTIEDDAMEDGLRWRAILRDPDGRVVDATLWVTSPAKATRDLTRLQRGEYWAHQAGDPWVDWVRAA